MDEKFSFWLQAEAGIEKPMPTKCPVKKKSCSLEDLEEYTIIIYNATVEFKETEEIKKLSSKFCVLKDYRTSNRELGVPIVTKLPHDKYWLFGFVAMEKFENDIDFVAYQKCINIVQRENRKLKNYPFEHVALNYIEDDDRTMEKLLILLSYSLRNVTIHLCCNKI